MTIYGGIHEILFVYILILATEVNSDYNKEFNWLLGAGLACIITFGNLFSVNIFSLAMFLSCSQFGIDWKSE